MREFQEKRKLRRWRRIYNSKLVVAALAIVVLFLARGTWNIYQKERSSAANAVLAANELKTLKERQVVLQKSLDKLRTDEGYEQEIRSKYSVSKPGESVIVIINSTSTATSTAQQQEGWWNKFKQLFSKDKTQGGKHE